MGLRAKKIGFRKIDLPRDKDELIEIECRVMYANERYLREKFDYPAYRERWYASGRPQEVIDGILKSLKDKRAICEFAVNTAGERMAFAYVTFVDVAGFDYTLAWLESIYVYEPFRRQGVASAVIDYLERRAREGGARLLAAGTSAGNIPSCRLHEKKGFAVYRNSYEKELC